MHLRSLLSTLFAFPPQSTFELIIPTTSGTIYGKIDPNFPNVRQFLGIPYAKPPTGELRFSAPEPLSQPDANVEATELPVSCMQYLNPASPTPLYLRDVLEFNLQGLNRTGPVSEDCLTLSIWTPSNPVPKKKLPVLIFLYGGGWQGGGQDVPYQIPTKWVNRSPEHIVVSFNYRVGIWGYPDALGLADQNAGLLDQRLAVEWLHSNIEAFGGDPSRMVLWGQSAGAASADFYTYAYPEDPIVTGLILDSGTALIPVRGDGTGTNFTFVADNVGCKASDFEERIACMREVPAARIQDFVAQYTINGTLPAINFAPIADGKTVFANYTERALANLQAKIPAIIGTNAQDGVPFAPYNPNGPNTTLAQAQLLGIFFCPRTETIRLRQETGRRTYSFLYSGNFTNISPKTWMGAYHSSELPLVMGTHSDFRGESTELEYETSWAMQDAWVAFAKDPVSGLDEVGWERYDRLGEGTVREFGSFVAPARDVSLEGTEDLCDGAVQRT